MASIKFIQRAKKLKNGEYGIYLRLIKNRKDRFIYINISCGLNDWNPEKQEFKKSHKDYFQKNQLLKGMKSRAETIIGKTFEQGRDISVEEFKTLFLDFKKDKKISVNEFWVDLISDFKKSGRIGNAKVYQETKGSLFKFLENKVLYFQDITPSLLSKYEVYLRERGNRESGISVRMRTIRAMYNDAILKGIVNKDNYPFEKYKISNLRSIADKRALSIQDIEKLINVDISKYPHLTDTKNYFVFSYYLGGINFVDMIKLTRDNINGDRLRYVRSKTKGIFDLAILPPAKDILEYYKDRTKNTNYLFPNLLHKNLTPMQIENRKTKMLKVFNSQLKELAVLVGIEAKLTSYVARHSFATNLKQLGESTDVISELLGHQNPSITQKYLKSFDKSITDIAMSKLIR